MLDDEKEKELAGQRAAARATMSLQEKAEQRRIIEAGGQEFAKNEAMSDEQMAADKKAHRENAAAIRAQCAQIKERRERAFEEFGKGKEDPGDGSEVEASNLRALSLPGSSDSAKEAQPTSGADSTVQLIGDPSETLNTPRTIEGEQLDRSVRNLKAAIERESGATGIKTIVHDGSGSRPLPAYAKAVLSRFKAKGISPEVLEAIDDLRDSFQVFASRIMQDCPPGRSQSLALTALEESSMWAIKAISHGE